MMYRYREVVCPFCDHKFMYNQNGREIIFYEYMDRQTGKYYIDTTCPKCAEKMIVVENELKGYFTDDNRFERSCIRGI